MKKIFLTSVLAISMIVPAIAETTAPDIAAGAESATCDSGTLNTTDGTSTLSAQWTANEITLKFYGYNNEQFATNTCIYDGGITLPASAPTRVGYNFAGWQVKQALFDLRTLDASIKGTGGAYTRLDGQAGSYEVALGLTPGSGEWATQFKPYYQIKGMAKCSAKSGNDHSFEWGGNSADWTAEESELTSASGEAIYCWCKATGYADWENRKGEHIPVSSPSWVFSIAAADADTCAHGCAYYCVQGVYRYSGLRSALYGISNN